VEIAALVEGQLPPTPASVLEIGCGEGELARAVARLGYEIVAIDPQAPDGEIFEPVARAPTVGVYRFWRDMGYVAGGLLAGVAADALSYSGAIAIVAGLTAASGLWVAVDLREGERRPTLATPTNATED
jgi:SAM-dependent methyltransferase